MDGWSVEMMLVLADEVDLLVLVGSPKQCHYDIMCDMNVEVGKYQITGFRYCSSFNLR